MFGFPDAIGPAKVRDATGCGYASACEDEDVVGILNVLNEFWVGDHGSVSKLSVSDVEPQL